MEYEKLQSHCRRVSELESRVAVFIEDLRLARHKQFGVVSENSEENLRKQRSFLLNEAVVFPAAGKTEVKNITVVRLYQYYKKHECIRNNIPECMVISGRRQEGEDLIYPKCGDIIT